MKGPLEDQGLTMDSYRSSLPFRRDRLRSSIEKGVSVRWREAINTLGETAKNCPILTPMAAQIEPYVHEAVAVCIQTADGMKAPYAIRKMNALPTDERTDRLKDTPLVEDSLRGE